MSDNIELFDSHLHIIDSRFPLVPNNGYIPSEFTHKAYLKRVSPFKVVGGAIVSGSFQAFDQSYLLASLQDLGPSFVGVTQLPYETPDDEIIKLHAAGVRALRFNLYRGGSESLKHMVSMASRVHELANWHIELYLDSTELDDLYTTLARLPSVSIDHLGMRKAGLPSLIKLAEHGVKVKATGFGRIDFDAAKAIKAVYHANPDALMFGTDLPSTRAPRPFQDSDVSVILDAIGSHAANKVFKDNAIAFYKPASS